MLGWLQYSVLLVVAAISLSVQGQNAEGVDLGNDLSEISGLALLGTDTFVGINDSGNKAELILFNQDGEPIKTVSVSNATNVDWEDLAMDDTYLYIGDIGNNLNKRKDLCVYKVRKSEVISQTKVVAEKIMYSYEDQRDFPPRKVNYNFDAEALVVKDDSLWIIAKNNAEPWSGEATIYALSKEAGNQIARERDTVFTGNNDWWEDAITGADLYNDQLYVLTYNRVLRFNGSNLSEQPKLLVQFDRITQKEAIVVVDNHTLFIADEKHRIVGGGKLYKIQLK